MKNYEGQLKFLQIIGMTALICTVLLWAMLWVSSAMNNSLSGELTSAVTSFIDNVFGVTDKIENELVTQSVNLKGDFKDSYTIGETLKLNVEYFPENTRDKDIVFSVADDILDITDDGVVTFKKRGTTMIKVRLKSNTAVQDKIAVICVGENVLDENHPERLKLSFEKDPALNDDQIPQCQTRLLLLNDDKTDSNIATYTSSNEDIAAVVQGRVYARQPGTATITATIGTGDNIKNIDFVVNVTPSENKPITSLNIAEDLNLYEFQEIEDYRTLFELSPDKQLKDYECFITVSNPSILNINGYILIAKDVGEGTITFRSAFNNDLVITKKLKVDYRQPNYLTIVGDDKIMPHTKHTYTGEHEPREYSDMVEWSIVSGNATIDEDGTLVANGYGKVVIRCQSLIDSDIYTEKTVNVVLFSSAYMFVRKLMGHAGLSALLGFGILATLFFNCKHKWLCLTAPAFAFIYAGVSEFIQLLTPGRVCLWSDVLVNFTGAVFGVAISVFIIALLLFIWWLVSKNGFKKLVFVLKNFNITNMYSKKKVAKVFVKIKENEDENAKISEETSLQEVASTDIDKKE